MNLQESIRIILKEETQAGLFLRRRVTEEELEEGLNDALKYGEEFLQRYPLLKMKEYREIVMNVLMDDIHGQLSNWGSRDFDYGGVRNYLTDMYIDRIRDKYNELKNESENNDRIEINERCWKGYTQKGMKTMFGKRYPNCVKVK